RHKRKAYDDTIELDTFVYRCAFFRAGLLRLFIGSRGVHAVEWMTNIQQNIEETKRYSAWEEVKEGFSYMRKNELIMSVVVMTFFLSYVFAGPLSVGMLIIVKDIFVEQLSALLPWSRPWVSVHWPGPSCSRRLN